MRASPCFTPQFRDELGQISFQTLYSISDMFKDTRAFWYFLMEIIKMLDIQVCSDYLNCGETVTN